MKTTFIAALGAAAALTAVAAPALAQPWDAGRYERSYERDYDRGYDRGYDRDWRDARDDRRADPIYARAAQLERQIERGARRGQLTRTEVRELDYSVRQFHRSEATFRSNGLNGRERAELNRQLNWLEARLEGRLNNGAYARR